MLQVKRRHLSALAAALFVSLALDAAAVKQQGAELFRLLHECTLILQNFCDSAEKAEILAWCSTLFVLAQGLCLSCDPTSGDFEIPREILKTEVNHIPPSKAKPTLDKIRDWTPQRISEIMPKFGTSLEFLRDLLENAGEPLLSN